MRARRHGDGRWVVGVSLLLGLLCACEGGQDSRDAAGVDAFDDGCAAPTALGECFVGDFFAECGGAAAPRLACQDERCLWFTGGCVANGFVPSDCPADDVCCHAGWPYLAGSAGDPGGPALHPTLFALGTAPWDRDTALRLTVTIDEAVAARPGGATCGGPDLGLGGNTPCSGAGAELAVGALPGTLILAAVRGPLVGWTPWIEVIADSQGARRARGCAYAFTDTAEASCPDRAAPVCADAGEVRLSRWPASDADLPGLVVAATLTFAGGTSVEWVGHVPSGFDASQ